MTIRRPKPKAKNLEPVETTWRCKVCTEGNLAHYYTCARCGNWRGAAPPAAPMPATVAPKPPKISNKESGGDNRENEK